MFERQKEGLGNLRNLTSSELLNEFKRYNFRQRILAGSFLLLPFAGLAVGCSTSNPELQAAGLAMLTVGTMGILPLTYYERMTNSILYEAQRRGFKIEGRVNLSTFLRFQIPNHSS